MFFYDKRVYMQRIQEAAGDGYLHYFTGKMARNKWPKFEQKMNSKYHLNLHRSTRWKYKNQGRSVGFLFAYQEVDFNTKEPLEVWFALMATDDVGRMVWDENMKPIQPKDKAERLRCDSFELVHDRQCWTWKMTREHLQMLREQIHRNANSPDPHQLTTEGWDVAALELQNKLINYPGFRLIRSQISFILSYQRSELRRYRSEGNGRKLPKVPFIR